MEECESLDSEMTELQSEASEAISQDDEDEVEELQNSLREVVQDQTVKPKLQCLMVDPSFSMVTVQSEDSGIVWETASSRCSTPWASETSSTSEAYSMEGSGAAGKITIVFDEEKVVRRRTRSGGRSSRLGDRLSRPGSSRSASALGVERPEMAEVSLPNVKQEKTETEPDLEEIKNKDQQLFSLISEGYEILNIRVPSKLPTVDEEESTELQDNLSYLDQTPKIRSRNHQDWTRQQNHFLPEEGEILDHQEPSKQDSSEPSADTESGDTTQKEGTGDIDYFEKFTLLDEVVPGEQAPELQEEAEQPAVKPQAEEQKSAKETATDSPSASEDSFVFVTDVEIVGEHLDEVFYGEGAPADALQRRDDDEAEGGARMRSRRESQRSMKESGSVLFGSEETILTPIYISPGPPKIIDPILLEEPTAMSFMYSDLYEDAMGEWRRSDEECSEAESVASEKSYKRRLSDSEEADGYLEKFILKDETPTVDVQPKSVEDKREGRMMWSQSKFEMTGCLTRVVREEDEETKTEEPKAQEVSPGDRSEDLQSATFEDKRETVTETEKEREETQLSVVTEEQAVREESIHESKRTDDQMEGQEVKRDQTEPPESRIDEPLTEIEEVDRKDVEKTERESEGHQSGEHERSEQSIIETKQPCQTQEVAEKEAEEVVKAAEEMGVKAPISSEVPQVDTQSEIQTETTEKGLSEEAATDTKMAVADEEVAAEKQEMLTSTEPSGEIETSAEMSLCEGKDAAEVVPEDVAPVEVITDCDCDCAVQAVVEVTEKVFNEKQIQTQVQIDIQEVTSAETTDAQTAAPEGEKEHEALAGETAAESQLPESVPDADQESEVKTETSTEVIEPEMPEDIKTDSDKKHHEILGSLQSVTDSESDKTKLTTEPKATTPMADIGPVVQEMVNVGDELILLVPKGQAIEMDIDVGQWSDKTTGGAELLPEPDSTCEPLIAPDDTPATMEETKTEPQLEVEPGAAVKVEELSIKDLDREHAPPAPVEDTEGKKTDVDLKGDDGVFSPLRSFTPQEDFCELHREDIFLEDAEKVEMHKVEDAPEAIIQDTSAPVEEIKTEPQLEVEADVAVEVEELSGKDLDMEHSTPAAVEEADAEGKKTEENLEGDDGVFSPLRSFTPREDLSELDKEDILLEEAEKVEIHKVEDATGAIIEDTPAPVEEIKTEPQLEIETDVAEDVKELSRKDLVREHSLPAPVDDIEEKKTEENLEGDEGVCFPPRSFTPREDLSELRREDILSEEAEKVEIHKMEDAVEAVIIKGGVGLDIDLHREDIGQKMEQYEVVAEAPEVPIEELEYEVISKQDAEEMPEPEIQKDADESRPESGQGRDQRVEVGLETEMEMEEKGLDLSPEEELIEDDYEIIDAEEESQARLAAELQGMDWFCLTCGCLLSEDDRVSGEHQSHDVTAVDKAYEEIKEKLSDWISELQGRSENIEDLVSELELAYNSVEDQCVESEAAMQAQNEEMMALVMEQYNNMSVSMEEEKKAKLEQLYDQIVSFQEGIDSAKATLETTAREAETDARSPEDIHARLKAALDSAMSLELGPKGLLVFEDYAKGNTSSSHLAQRKGIPVPQKPTLQPQEPGSATSTSVTVYWKVNPGDIIDCFQVYCMEDPQGAVSEEYRVTVKESYCVLEELEPDKTYKVWVMAVNYTGCSLPSERLAFTTAPSVPVIDTERCTVMWDSATLRWQQQSSRQSYTLEYCRQYELEGEGLRSISGIKSCEQRVLLQPNENYLFYIKAVNEAGASEQSEAALISTKGTRFHLLKASAHPALELSVDQTTLHYPQDTYENTPLTDKQCPSILGELLPARGHYYWETAVSGSPAYRLGVAHSAAGGDGSLGENSQSWCLQCVPTPSGCRYQLLHNDAQSSVFVIEMPERVGALLDYQLGRLSFYNARSGQLLGTFSQRFAQPCHPALALEMPGSLEVCMVPEVPEFTKDS